MSDLLGCDIHPTAIVDKSALLGRGVVIGPYSIIGPSVELGDGVRVMSHACIQGKTRIGDKTVVYPFASLGTDPQDLKFSGEDTELVCGTQNVFREYVNISIGTKGGGGVTTIGDNNLFMVNSHIAHDCTVGSRCILANGVSLAGHIEVGDGAVLGGHVAIHQFVKVGALAMLAGGSILVQDVPPFCTVHGNHASPAGLNLLGLKRSGRTISQIKEIKRMYKYLFQSSLTLEEAVIAIREKVTISDDRDQFLNFLEASKRGVSR